MQFSDQLRKAIDDSGLSRYAICKATSIDQSAMSRFMSGERGLLMPAVDAICELLELRIVKPAKARTRKAR